MFCCEVEWAPAVVLEDAVLGELLYPNLRQEQPLHHLHLQWPHATSIRHPDTILTTFGVSTVGAGWSSMSGSCCGLAVAHGVYLAVVYLLCDGVVQGEYVADGLDELKGRTGQRAVRPHTHGERLWACTHKERRREGASESMRGATTAWPRGVCRSLCT